MWSTSHVVAGRPFVHWDYVPITNTHHVPLGCPASLHYGSSGTYLPVKGAVRHGHSDVREGPALVSRGGQAHGAGHRPGDRRRRVHGARRPVRVRQVHDPADARGAGGGQRGQDLHRGPRHHAHPAQGPRHRDGVPELRALPPHVGRRQHGLRPEDGQGVTAGRAAEARRGGRQDPRPHRVPRAQAQGPLRWPAAARRHGPRDRAQPAGLLHGRAAVQPRRQDARADPHRHRQAPVRPRCHHGLRHPRPGRGDDDGRPGRGDEGRRPPAGRHPAEASTTSRSTSSSPASSALRR